MPEHIPYLRVFISSPGDVTDERKLALDVIKRLPNRPALRDRVAFRIVAWDDIGADTPMRATLTPQEAINQGLPTPSECDIVVVLFWSRMGTPFIHTDGKEYQSGTHWELLDALNSSRTETLIYGRTEEKLFKSDDKDGIEQNERVKAFFKSDLFYKDGRALRGINFYAAPDEFRQKFEAHFEDIVVRLLRKLESAPRPADPAPPSRVVTVEREPWPPGKSPFPGLRVFTEADADIFFGRGYETDALVRQLIGSRFIAVVGASGSGKSSLVGAGLIPRLHTNAIPGSKDWRMARFTPGEAPFEHLYAALLDAFPQLKPNPLEARRIKQYFMADLREAPATLVDICAAGLDGAPDWAEVLLFIDQFEELFTQAGKTDAQVFAAMLESIAHCERVRVVVTMRADFYHRAVEYPQLAELLRAGSFPLAIPKRDALRQMIERPAERAGLEFERGLVEQILDDTGDEPGNLALMAYALDELYKRDEDRRLSHDEYEQLVRVAGAIGTRAESVFAGLGIDEKVIQQVFHALVEVDKRGTATRRRVQFQPETLPEPMRVLIEAFTKARLLTTNYDESGQTVVVEVAHEAILRSWPRLAEWIEDTQDDLRLLRQVRNAAQEWEEKGRPDFLRWPQERLVLVYAMRDRLSPKLNEVERDFIEPEQDRLLRELDKPETTHKRRRDIGDRLAVIGDTRSGVGVKDGLPELLWLPVELGGEITIEEQEFIVQPFFIAQYQITYAQFQTFLDAQDGFEDERWWAGMPGEYTKQEMGQQRTKIANASRDKVSWYQCVAFARWLDAQYRTLGLFDRMVVGTRCSASLRNGVAQSRSMANPSADRMGMAVGGAKRERSPRLSVWKLAGRLCQYRRSGLKSHDRRRDVPAGRGGLRRAGHGGQPL